MKRLGACVLLVLPPAVASSPPIEQQDPVELGAALAKAWDELELALYRSLDEDVTISLVDTRGECLPLTTPPGERHPFGLPLDWPERARVFVMTSASEAWTDRPRRLLQGGKTIAEGTAAFELAGAGSYVAVLLAPGAAARIEAFEYERDAEASVMTMQLPEPGPTGELTVDVRNPSGGAHSSNVELFILDARTLVPLLSRADADLAWTEVEPEWPVRFHLPVGEYLLVARDQPPVDWHGRALSPRRYADARVPFSISADETLELRVPLAVAAYLDLRLCGRADADDLAEVRRRLQESGALAFTPEQELAREVSLRLRRPAGYPQPLEFERYAWANTSAAGRHHMTSLILRDEPCIWTSEPVPAGTYTLEARLPGGRHLSREVVLTQGETTAVELDFGGE